MPKDSLQVKNMTNTEKNVKLDPIVCRDCGASVPLPEKAQTTCPYCSASIETPEEYLKWRFRELW
jgi:predicted Zn-ribbon and HTH transcriptional regulator